MTVEENLREQNDILRRRIGELKEVNERQNLVIADIANECERYVKELQDFKAVTFKVTTQATLDRIKETWV